MGQESERIMILDLLEKGKINSEEADKLLSALNPAAHVEATQPVELDIETDEKPHKAHWMRIRVTELSTGKRKFGLLLPLIFLKLGISFSERQVKTDKEREGLLMGREFFRNAVKGKMVDASDPEDDERVEITFL